MTRTAQPLIGHDSTAHVVRCEIETLEAKRKRLQDEIDEVDEELRQLYTERSGQMRLEEED